MSNPGQRRSFRFPWRSAKQLQEEVDEEIGFHIEMRATELERQGMNPAAAREEALRRFGDLKETREVCFASDQRRENSMRRREYFGEVAQDLGHGLRQLRRRPVFAAAGILTLAVGIGATTAIFSAADHVLLRPLPYQSPDRVVTLWETDRASGEDRKGASPGNFVQWRDRAGSFSVIGLAEPFGYDLTGDGPPEPLGAWTVTEGFTEALGVVPLIGRTFRPEDFGAGKPSVALISHGLWQRRFGGDPAIVGRAIQLDGAPVMVIGVLPSGLEHPEPRDVWTPKVLIERELNDRSSSYMVAVGRLRPGATLEQARADMARVATSLGTEYPQTNSDTGVNLVPLREQILGSVRPALVVLLAAVGFLLLIACGNVANLLLARGAERERELGVRAALGAGRARLVRQLATESLLLGVLGGAVGLLLGWAGVRTLTALVPANFPRVDTIALDARALVFAVFITLLSTLLFGLAPSLRFSRPDLMGTLRGGSRGGSGGRERSRLRGALMVSQISLALVLLIGAGLLARSFVSLLSNDPGFQTENRAALQLFLWDRNPTKEQRLQRVDELTERFESVAGVEKVAVVSALPFHPNQIAAQDELLVEGRAAPLPGQKAQVFTTTASPDYFGIMGIPLRRGRGFMREDRPDAPQVALINETLARRFFPDEDPIGKRVTIGMMSRPVTREIVGVVGDVRPKALDSEARPELFVPYSQSGTGSITFVMRTRRDPAALLPALKSQVWEVDPSQTIYHAATVNSLISETLATRRFHLVLLATFSLVALALASIGVYGVMSFATSQRMQEIGVRLALGARPGDVSRMILSQGLSLGLGGVVLGIAGALLLTRFMAHMLYGITPTDPATFALLTMLMLGIAALGTYLPARRAAAADPLRALRQE